MERMDGEPMATYIIVLRSFNSAILARIRRWQALFCALSLAKGQLCLEPNRRGVLNSIEGRGLIPAREDRRAKEELKGKRKRLGLRVVVPKALTTISMWASEKEK